MKKILALVLAVVMLASLATVAMAADEAETEGFLRFIVDDVQYLPPAYGHGGEGWFCPVRTGPGAPTPAQFVDGTNRTGGWTEPGSFGFLNHYGSNDLYFGRHPIPPRTNWPGCPVDPSPFGNPITFEKEHQVGTIYVNLAENRIPRHRGVLGMGVQAWIIDGADYPYIELLPNDPPGSTNPKPWELEVIVGEFRINGVPGNEILQLFALHLEVNDPTTPSPLGRGPQTFPRGLNFEHNYNELNPLPDDDYWSVYDLVLNQCDGTLPAPALAARGYERAVFGWEWTASLVGAHLNVAGTPTGTNKAPGEIRAEVMWNYINV